MLILRDGHGSPRAGHQPIPAQTMICEQDGVTAIGRTWLDGDHRRCTLCPACGAEPIPGVAGAAVCLIQTDERVEDDEADLYSLADADVRGGTPRPTVALALTS